MALYQHKNVILNGQKYNCLLLSQSQLDAWSNRIINISAGDSISLVEWTTSDLPSYLTLGHIFYNPKVNSTTHYLTINNGGFISEYVNNQTWTFGVEYNSSRIQVMWSASDGQNDTYISPGIITNTDTNRTYIFRIYSTAGGRWNITCSHRNEYYSIFNGTENLWENITVNLKHNITQATILDMNAATANQECNYDTNTLFTPGTDFRDFAISGTEYNQDMIFADDELMLYKKYESYIQCYSYYHSSSDNGGGWKIYYQGEAIGGYTGGTFGKYDKYFGVAFLVDEEHEYGQIIECYSYYPNTSWNQKHYTKRLITNSNMLHKAYLLIKEILTGAKVKVNYMIPEGDYQYCKLTYKADYQPENQNDGTSIDISPNASSVNVEGLDENQLYYFTLFTDKSESEPFPFTATPDPVPPNLSYIKDVNQFYVWDRRSNTHGCEFFSNYEKPLKCWQDNIRYDLQFEAKNWTFTANNMNHYDSSVYGTLMQNVYTMYPKNTIRVVINQDNSVNVEYSVTENTVIDNSLRQGYQIEYRNDSIIGMCAYVQNATGTWLNTSFENLESAISYIFIHYCNINLYVDNVKWI